jgi:chemotaxis protein MotA
MTTTTATTNNLNTASMATATRSPWVTQQLTVGFLICMASLATAVYMAHIPLQVLVQPTALLLVVGGTLGALCLSNPLPAVFGAFWKSSFLAVDETVCVKSLEDLVADLIDIASFARREGLLALTPYLAPLATTEPFLYACLQRLSDNKNQHQLEADLGVLYQQGCHAVTKRIRILEQAAGYLPTMGLMGALLGILQVFSNQNNTGVSEATAQLGQLLPFASELTACFSATLLGIGLANWLCLPLAQTQQNQLNQLQQKYALIIEGVLNIHRNEHPLQLQETLKLHLQGAIIEAGGTVGNPLTESEESSQRYAANAVAQTRGISTPKKPQATGSSAGKVGQPPFLAASTTQNHTIGGRNQ